MKTAIIAALAATALAVPAIASAQTTSGLTGSIAYTQTDVSSGGPNLGAVTGRLSWNSGMYWGLEGEGSAGVKRDTNAGVSYKLNSQFAGYVTATAPVAPNFELFGRVGYGTTRVSSNPAGAGGSNESVNYGVGANWFWDSANGVRADYLRENFQNGGSDANVWSVGYVRRF